MQKILIIEDDEKLRNELETFLNKNGFVATSLKKFDNAVEDILNEKADLLLLDINLPYTDGEFICKEIRKTSNVPIIMVTSRDSEMDELLSLNYGADQYVTKPYNIQILLAKIVGLLKRNQNAGNNPDKIDCGEFVLNTAGRIAEKEDNKVELTKNEYKILEYLVLHRQQVISRDEIMDYLWESEEFVDDNTLNVNIKRLRTKLTELGLIDQIETRRGTGVSIKMRFKDFIKEKILLIFLLLFLIISSEILLLPYTQIGVFTRLYIAICPILIIGIDIAIEYRKKKNFYNELKSNLDELADKYLISEIINTPDFLEGKILKKSMQEAGKSMLENVNTYKRLQEDYKEYIELWIHEIKIPIATSKLIIENNKNEITKSIDEELDEIENYTEQALFYARSNTVNKDYIITKSNLQEIVNGAILKNKGALLSSKTSIELHDLEREVYTDSKWAVFIINQIIQNAIKYSKIKDRKIEIYAISKRENVVLYIKDNGIGIKKGEITRVFEKGFTGENGRTINKKSTGIGLYLCKKLCNKLGLGIELNSEKGIGTEVRIIFPKSSFMNL